MMMQRCFLLEHDVHRQPLVACLLCLLQANDNNEAAAAAAAITTTTTIPAAMGDT
jgi:hypothetical protein